jgi:transcriptional regulator of acetoin/glycerol metabolism
MHRPLTADAAEALMIHPWPKNIRELKHVAEAIALYPDRSEIDIELLELAAERIARGFTGLSNDGPSKDRLIELLEEHQGNVSRVAKALNQHRTQVHRWLKLFGLESDDYRPR